VIDPDFLRQSSEAAGSGTGHADQALSGANLFSKFVCNRRWTLAGKDGLVITLAALFT
jgi:hypothetical protein